MDMMKDLPKDSQFKSMFSYCQGLFSYSSYNEITWIKLGSYKGIKVSSNSIHALKSTWSSQY
jgi:hypothetical protein